MKKYSFPTYEEVININRFVSKRNKKNIRELSKHALAWTKTAWENKMDYEVSWFGIPMIQNPYDMMLMQELIFSLKPDVVVETGIAHGGSLIYYSSMLELLGKGEVIGIDISIREHNRKLLDKHPLIKRVTMIEGNSIDEKVISQVKKRIRKNDKVLVILDSDHRKHHVYKELEIYKHLVSKDSYIVVCDTFLSYITTLKNAMHFKNDNPLDAVRLFIQNNKSSFIIDRNYNKFFVSNCPNGFIKRIK